MRDLDVAHMLQKHRQNQDRCCPIRSGDVYPEKLLMYYLVHTYTNTIGWLGVLGGAPAAVHFKVRCQPES